MSLPALSSTSTCYSPHHDCHLQTAAAADFKMNRRGVARLAPSCTTPHLADLWPVFNVYTMLRHPTLFPTPTIIPRANCLLAPCLHPTTSLASHINNVRMLAGVLVEHKAVTREVSLLGRWWMTMKGLQTTTMTMHVLSALWFPADWSTSMRRTRGLQGNGKRIRAKRSDKGSGQC